MSIVTTPTMRKLWNDAQIHPEWATTRLWEYIFNHNVFTEEDWVVASQQPPTHKPGDLRRVDIVVEKIDNDARTVGTLLFVEAKRASASLSDIDQVEYQAFTAACAYSITNEVENIWAMTCVGSKARIWIFQQNAIYMTPFVPKGEGLSAKHEYLEIDTHGETILNALRYCKTHMRVPDHLLKKENSEASPRPANVTLPPGWHDDEVAEMDSNRRN
ncbi:hypothetical protein F5Y18DRAFT_34188 [Xylariaceae sp. FL1019]|nr:hypothetical protein F5Y18DRAFT_34188 [Xylariaceae sp. FL1019]